MCTLYTFQKLLVDISYLWSTNRVKTQELSNLCQTLEGDKDLNSPRGVSVEYETELILVKYKLQDAHVDQLDL